VEDGIRKKAAPASEQSVDTRNALKKQRRLAKRRRLAEKAEQAERDERVRQRRAAEGTLFFAFQCNCGFRVVRLDSTPPRCPKCASETGRNHRLGAWARDKGFQFAAPQIFFYAFQCACGLRLARLDSTPPACSRCGSEAKRDLNPGRWGRAEECTLCEEAWRRDPAYVAARRAEDEKRRKEKAALSQRPKQSSSRPPTSSGGKGKASRTPKEMSKPGGRIKPGLELRNGVWVNRWV
jgi:predicted Zn-ribbon and HTH transcriptional regulator